MSDDEDEKQRFAEYFAARQVALRRTAYLLCGDWHWADEIAQIYIQGVNLRKSPTHWCIRRVTRWINT